MMMIIIDVVTCKLLGEGGKSVVGEGICTGIKQTKILWAYTSKLGHDAL